MMSGGECTRPAGAERNVASRRPVVIPTHARIRVADHCTVRPAVSSLVTTMRLSGVTISDADALLVIFVSMTVSPSPPKMVTED
jgi:hypothetical protein